MSRTDKHAPYWTWAVWYEPAHGLWCNRRYACNLPDNPVRQAGRGPHVLTNLCTWEPIWPVGYCDQARLFGRYNPPRWFRRHVWSAPERVRERVKLGEMAKEHNANGDLDDGDFPNRQHRHGALWDWH
jgi:hypothetical protein